MRCTRPACDRPAEATLGYDSAARRAWLAPGWRRDGLALCTTHADRTAVPLGWVLDDRRAPAEPAPPPPPIEDPTRWEPRFDPADDLGGLLAATSPLLGRALAGRAPTPPPRRRSRRPPRDA